ncbi:MAG: transketolase C-terminal domain-containing protein, partial [Pseudomonadota bacterium]|nr:transketolase C-terminal domain-containing protein [Pseudomonadota bacterium]
VRVVSMPCAELFDAQEAGYKEAVLPSDMLARVAVEAGHKDFWYKYVGLDGHIVGMTGFGESAPAATLFQHFGLTTDNLVTAIEDVILD